MADIFISYSKADRDIVVLLAAMLEAEGWTVWWDTSLIPGDDFRNVIMTELAKARAAIVVWTDTSVKSDWVRSEAGRAQMDRKLIPVKQAHLGYKDLPPPFDVLHTEDIDNHLAIKAGVVGQLSKPAVEPSGWWLLTKELSFQVLMWAGIVTGALTLFSSLVSLLHLADWARWLVTHWEEWTHAFWVWMFSWIGWRIEFYWSPVLTAIISLTSVAIGQSFAASTAGSGIQNPFRMNRWVAPIVILASFFLAWAIPVLIYIRTHLFLEPPLPLPHGLAIALANRNMVTIAEIHLASLIVVPIAALLILLRQRLTGLVATALSFLAAILLAFAPLQGMHLVPSFSTEAMMGLTLCLPWLLPLIMLSIAPSQLIVRRLFSTLMGVAILLALNELSKLGLTLFAPTSAL